MENPIKIPLKPIKSCFHVFFRYCPIPDFSGFLRAQGLPGGPWDFDLGLQPKRRLRPSGPKPGGLDDLVRNHRFCIKKMKKKGWTSEKSTRNSPNKLDGQIGQVYKNGWSGVLMIAMFPLHFAPHSKADYILGNVWQNRTWRLGMAVPGVTKWMATLVQQVFFCYCICFFKTVCENWMLISELYQTYLHAMCSNF